MYIETGKIEKALIIGVDILSRYTNKEDIGTAILLSDGAGVTLVGKTNKCKKYDSNISAEIDNGPILINSLEEKIYMEGKHIYKYAVTSTVQNINELLEKSNEKIENIKYIIPHQSNKKIMKSIATRLKIQEEKIFMNIKEFGNTFCASIPIALSQIYEQGLLNSGDKIILLGYGGGLNTGSILLEL